MKIHLPFVVAFIAFFHGAVAQPASTRLTQFNLDESTLALEGYDPVAYFTSDGAIEGNEKITTTYNSITYRFATTRNRDLFTANPGKYEPQYGGWCAYAMGTSGEKVEVDPETFKIVEGRLYLFYNRFFNNTLTDWNEDEVNLKANADKNWKRFVR